MLKKFIQRMRPNNDATSSLGADPSHEPITLHRDEHSVSRKQISKGALRVLYDLQNAGFESYLVGGGIRDLLLGKQPKDFDVATNATPEQVVKLFKRARIVGRRFRIAHVRFGREVIEVTTFRAAHTDSTSSKRSKPSRNNISQQNDQGMLLRDNVYGSLREDALRRDFTVNALYYTVDGFRILDYANGIADLENRTLRIIGDPAARYREDPVRMLRAIRFKALLSFDFDPATEAPISELAPLLGQVSAARMYDEINKLLLSQQGAKTFDLLQEYQLLDQLLPHVAALVANRHSSHYKLIHCALQNTAVRLAENKPVTPAFLYACLFWPRVIEISNASNARNQRDAIRAAGYQVVEEQLEQISIPKRISGAMREIWNLQNDLEHCKEQRTVALLSQQRFRAGYDFLLMREQSGESPVRNAAFWTELQLQHPDAVYDPKQAKLDAPDRHKAPRRRSRRPSSARRG